MQLCSPQLHRMEEVLMCPDLSPTDVISLGVDLKDREAQKTESGKHLIQTEMRRKFYGPVWVDAGNIIALQTQWSKEFTPRIVVLLLPGARAQALRMALCFPKESPKIKSTFALMLL